MISIQTARRILALGIFVGACFAVPAQAATISVIPASGTATVGTPFDVDIVVGGLGPADAVGGVSFVLTFDPILQGTNFVLDPEAKMGGAVDLGTSFGAGGTSPFETFFLSGEVDPTALLALQQPGGVFTPFSVARLTFDPIGTGLANLILSTKGIFLSQADGETPIATQAANGTVCVGAPGAPANCDIVPEPGILALLGTGVAAVLVRRRRKVQAQA